MAFPALLFVHGAANGAWVWDFWCEQLKARGWEAIVLDLRGHGRSLSIDMSVVTMDDYVQDLGSVAGQVAAARGRHPVVVGWSMGGLVAMMYAALHPETPALVLLSPSPPLQVAGRADADVVRQTPAAPFGPEVYGIYPGDLEASRRTLFDLTDDEARRVLEHSAGAVESGFARRQRRRGIEVPAASVRAPALVVFGEDDAWFVPEVNCRTALYLGADTVELPGLGHWGIVYSEKGVADAAGRVDEWLRRTLSA